MKLQWEKMRGENDGVDENGGVFVVEVEGIESGEGET